MRIGFFIRKWGARGGMERYAYRLASWLAEREHEIHVVCERAERERSSTCHVHQTRVSLRNFLPGCPTLKIKLWADQCEKIAMELDLDATISFQHGPRADILRLGGGCHTAYQEKLKLDPGATRRDVRRENPLAEMERESYCDNKYKRLIAVSPMVAQEVRFHFPKYRGKIDVLINPPPADPPDALFNGNVADPHATQPRVLFAGPDGFRKGLDRFLSIANSLCEVLPGTESTVVGIHGKDGKYEKKRKISNIIWMQYGENILKNMAECDALVLPTRYDPLANSCLEAAAVGVGVFTTTANGFSSLLEEVGLTHWILDRPDDPDHCAQKIKNATASLDWFEHRRELQRRVRAITIADHVGRIEALLESCRRKAG